MIRLEMIGRAILFLGILLVGSGTIVYLSEPPQGSQNTFCEGRYCIVKSPIYCYRTLHGVLFDTGWLLVLAGAIILAFYGIRRPKQATLDRKP